MSRHCGKVVGTGGRVQRIYPYEDQRSIRTCRQPIGDGGARGRLPIGGHRVFQVKDQAIRPRGRGFTKPFRPVTWHEQQRAQHHEAERFSSAVRRHWQTISERWLYNSWRNVMIPASGRERLSRRSTISVSARIVSPMKTGFGITSLS